MQEAKYLTSKIAVPARMRPLLSNAWYTSVMAMMVVNSNVTTTLALISPAMDGEKANLYESQVHTGKGSWTIGSQD